MRVLAFDTCFGAVSVAVRWPAASGAWLLREVYEERDTGQAERLIPLIEEVMGAAGLAFADLDRIAVTRGPGSFTGVRTGLSAARGLALAAGLPLVGATSLAVMALRANALISPLRPLARLAVVVDGRRGGLYVQVFGEDVLRSASEPALLDLAAAVAAVAGEAIVAVGSGAAALAQAAGHHVTPLLPDLLPHARHLAMLAPALSPLADPDKSPLYLRPPDAKPGVGASLLRSTR